MQNESKNDRMMRLVAGVVVFIAAFLWTTGYLKWVLFVIAAIMLVTSFTGFCLLYKLFGISTIKEKAKKATFVKPTKAPVKKLSKTGKKK